MYRVRNKQAAIPYIIRKVHPKMKAHEFEKIKDEDYFKLKKTLLCYNCYFQLSKTHNYGGNDKNPYKIREKKVSSRPRGQTLNVSEKLKVEFHFTQLNLTQLFLRKLTGLAHKMAVLLIDGCQVEQTPL